MELRNFSFDRSVSKPARSEWKYETDEERTNSLLFFAGVIVFSLFLAMITGALPLGAHAKEQTPHRDYPLTNAGTCMRLHKEGMQVRGASVGQVTALCRLLGVDL